MPPKPAPQQAGGAQAKPATGAQPQAQAQQPPKQEENSDDDNHLEKSGHEADDIPTDNIREYILKHYGINAEEEKAKKEKRVLAVLTPRPKSSECTCRTQGCRWLSSS